MTRRFSRVAAPLLAPGAPNRRTSPFPSHRPQIPPARAAAARVVLAAVAPWAAADRVALHIEPPQAGRGDDPMITTIPISASLPATQYSCPCVLPRALSRRTDALNVVLRGLPAKGAFFSYAMKFLRQREGPSAHVEAQPPSRRRALAQSLRFLKSCEPADTVSRARWAAVFGATPERWPQWPPPTARHLPGDEEVLLVGSRAEGRDRGRPWSGSPARTCSRFIAGGEGTALVPLSIETPGHEVAVRPGGHNLLRDDLIERVLEIGHRGAGDVCRCHPAGSSFRSSCRLVPQDNVLPGIPPRRWPAPGSWVAGYRISPSETANVHGLGGGIRGRRAPPPNCRTRTSARRSPRPERTTPMRPM